MKNILIKTKGKLKKQTVRNRYFVLLLSMSVLPLFLLGFISFQIAKNTLIQNQLKTTQEHLRTSSEVADLLLRNVVNMERLIAWNKEAAQELKESAVQRTDKQAEIFNEDTPKQLRNMLSSYLIDTQDIDSVCIFNRDFRSFCYGNSGSMGDFDKNKVYSSVSGSDWYKKTVKSNGKPLFFGSNVLNNNSVSTFSSVKLLKDPSNLIRPEIIGILVVNIKTSLYTKAFNKDQNSYLVIDSSGTDPVTVYNDSPRMLPIVNQSEDLPSLINELQRKHYLVSQYSNQTTGWTFLHLVPEKALVSQSNQIGLVTAFISSIMAFVALFLSFYLSGTLTRPFLQLKAMAMEWGKGVGAWASDKKLQHDEIAAIGSTFKQISEENKDLNQRLIRSRLKEKEAELSALQAQIKPHFLYNTLDLMYWKAIMHENHDLANMSIALSETFKLSLNNGNELISVSKELEHIQHYMTIQNMRYNHRFCYLHTVDSELMDKKILKLLLQPLVENAIYHGLEPKLGEGTVSLHGAIRDGFIIFTVEDDGIGMEDLSITESGYGLKNVRERLALYYGPSSELGIFSKANEGTKIEIKFKEEAGMMSNVESSNI
ncbi:sensor histidine kinase [Fictibacillus enclensis]|uniref:sensor histidine kinase n=1 Tax=Fictibacillus enclensis TaxID=1017270 RepID=UPI0025A2E7DA|nr:sensor histidine kinase [Fictibacillus enclensis]MDM5338581.1 sensor histidine kinase [Fictibacillus enclensis]